MNYSAIPWASIRKWVALCSVVALPWQTRFVARERWLNGFPWEQGRWSFYATWILMLVLIAWSVYEHRRQWTRRSVQYAVGAIVVACFALIHSASLVASAQWMFQIAVLGGWVWAMRDARIPVQTVGTWFVYSLIPVGVLACVQWVTQHTFAASWLGLAGHVPADLGASIVETAHGRWLRVYGSFPHPNIAGIWFAIGAYVSAVYYTELRSRVYAFAAITLSAPLFFTQSRAAVLALIVGLIALCVRHVSREAKRMLWGVGALFLMLTSLYSWVVLPRFSGTAPAEVRSTHERLTAFSQGWELFSLHPLLGAGPNAAGEVWYEQHPWRDTSDHAEPYIPLHNVFFLLVVELGVIGTGALIWLLYRAHRAHAVSFWVFPPVEGAFLVLAIFSFFDHAAWSWWSGQSLVALTILLLDMPRARPLIYTHQ